MRRWWNRALVALLAALALAAPVPATPLRAQGSDADALLRELAQRLLSPPFPVPGGAASVQLYPGALPPDLPFELPLPPDSRLIGSVVRPSFGPSSGPVPAPTGESIDVVLDVPGEAGAVTDFYRSVLAEQGWSIPVQPSYRQSGFLPSFVPAAGVTFCQNGRGPWLSVTVSPMDGGPSDVRVHIDTGNPGPCGASGRPAPPSEPPGSDLLPPLPAPEGVLVSSIGGSGAPGRFGSDALAQSDRTPADLESYYAGLLAAAGWTRIDGAAAGPLAWSTWSVPDPARHDDAADGPWEGFLYVRAGARPDERWLHVEVASATSPAGSVIGTGTTTITSVAP